MSLLDERKLTRREFLLATAGVSALGAFAAACGDDDVTAPQSTATSRPATAEGAPGQVSPTPGASLAPTPACSDDDDVTPDQTGGPFFTPDSPERTSLREAGMAGTPLTLTGYVLSTSCAPVAGALLDFWHADDAGEYDNNGYRLRGHQFTGEDGRYTLETIVPGLYTGRTRHIHVKAQAPDRPVLTTQLYFPGEPDNSSDGIFDGALLMDIQGGNGGQAGTFNFALELG